MKIILSFLALLFICKNTFAQGYIDFVENKGQWQNELKYLGQIKNGAFAITTTGYKVNMYDAAAMQKNDALKHTGKSNELLKVNGHSWEVNFLNANKNATIVPAKPLEFLSNYYKGNDATKWASGCKTYNEIQLQNIYDNIDARYYTSNGTLKYDLIVKPNAKVDEIVLQYNGLNKINTNKKGNLIVETSIGSFEEMVPYCFQNIDGQKTTIASKYKVEGNKVSFKLANYDNSKTLIIDPSLIFSTHSGSTADNWGMTATYGPDETFFGGGWIQGNGFTTATGPINGAYNGDVDICIIKLDATGTSRIFATYIGGANKEQPQSLISDAVGNLFIYGRTNSPDFPTSQKYGTGGGYDIAIVKLNTNGSLNRSIVVGGSNNEACNITDYQNQDRISLEYNYGDDGRGEINLDGAGNVIVASCTQSTNFFTTAGAAQATFGGGTQDAVIFKFNATLTSPIFSTYFGGNGNDAAYVITESKGDGNLYFAGGTESPNLTGTSTSVLQQNYAGGVDGYISSINAAGANIVRSTYLGTASHDQIYGLQFDKNNYPYIMGISLGSMPVVNAAYSNAGSHQFIAKLNKDLSSYVYATKFGTNNNNTSPTNISPVAFLVDNCENVYVSGWGGEIILKFPNASTTGLPITPDALKSTTDGRDFYYFVLERNASSQLFGSFFGGNSSSLGEHVDGGTSRFDPKGIIYQAACASCGVTSGAASYPVTAGGLANGGSNCNLGMTKIRFNYTGVIVDLNASDTTGCAPLNVTFKDNYQNAVSYEYSYGDGSPSLATTNPQTTHLYNTPGIYVMRIIAINLASCNLRDTAYKVIKVRYPAPTLNFTGTKQPPCLNLTYLYKNLSTIPTGSAFTNNSFIWDFGDGSPTVTANLTQQTHTYTAPGLYNVKLKLADTSFCSYPDSLLKPFRLSTTVKADFTVNNGCNPHSATITNTSLAGSVFLWNFGDGGTSNQQYPNYTFNNPGTFTVQLIVIDTATCNFKDTLRKTVTIYSSPKANFNFSPNPPIINTPTQFNNTTTNATIYKWIFGDGDSSIIVNPLHQFIKTGTFNTCLQASNQFGCRDTICQTVPAIVQPLIDVPNALTPNGDGVNDIVIPRGFGIETITFRIFNRWGNLLFETNQRNVGWDGKYKGQVQPMEVYSFTLDAKLFDGTKVKKSGNITLIR